MMSTSFQNAIASQNTGSEIGVLFPSAGQQFLILRPETEIATPRPNGAAQPTQTAQEVTRQDVLVRLPSLRDSEWRVTVLQRWVGRVERVEADRFIAVLDDATSRRNPLEQVEMDLQEVSESDLPLLAEGAMFYWSIGYRDTPGGQRERISTVRFARQPRLGSADIRVIFDEADHLARFLESE